MSQENRDTINSTMRKAVIFIREDKETGEIRSLDVGQLIESLKTDFNIGEHAARTGLINVCAGDILQNIRIAYYRPLNF